MLALTEAVEISLGGVTFQAAVDHKIRVRKEKNRWRFRTFAHLTSKQMAKKKQKKQQCQQFLSPEQYIKEKARSLEIGV